MSDKPHINGDTNVTPITDAKKIMDNPAGESGTATETSVTSPHIKDAGTARLLDQLPGLVGAIDTAIKDTAGKPMVFMLLVFAPDACLHATNAHPPEMAMAAVKQVVADWDTNGVQQPGAAANDAAPQE